MPVINCLSPWPIVVESTRLEYGVNIENRANKYDITGLQLSSGESENEIYLARTNKHSEIPITIGQYTIKWKRLNGKSTVNCVTILGPTVDWSPLDMKITVPSHGFVRTLMLVEYHLQNKSSQIVHVDVSVEGSDVRKNET